MSEGKTKLSKSILQMKFMKRTKDKVIKDAEDAEQRAMYSNEITNRMLENKTNYIYEQSYVPCENLIVGRISCRGMNPEIERILEREENLKRGQNELKSEKDITDTDMAKHYSTLVDKIGRKFDNHNKKRKLLLSNTKNDNNNDISSNKKLLKFMRPAE